MAASSRSSSEARKLAKLKEELEMERKKIKVEKAKLEAEKNKMSVLSQKITEKKAHMQKHASDDLRTMRKQITELKRKNKLLERRASMPSVHMKSKLDSSSNLMNQQTQKETKRLKKRLKASLKELAKQKQFYQTQISRFQLQQEKWIAKQKEALKHKNYLIKYVCLDDIVVVKKYRPGKPYIKVITRNGEEVIINQAKVIKATAKEEEADAEHDTFVKEFHEKLAKSEKKSDKTRAKSTNNIDTESIIENSKKRKKKKASKLAKIDEYNANTASSSSNSSSSSNENENENENENDNGDNNGSKKNGKGNDNSYEDENENESEMKRTTESDGEIDSDSDVISSDDSENDSSDSDEGYDETTKDDENDENDENDDPYDSDGKSDISQLSDDGVDNENDNGNDNENKHGKDIVDIVVKNSHASLIQELKERENDLHVMNEIFKDKDRSMENENDSINKLVINVKERHDGWMQELENENSRFEMFDDLASICKSWQDEIGQFSASVNAHSNKADNKNEKNEMNDEENEEYNGKREKKQVENETEKEKEKQDKNKLYELINLTKEMSDELQGRIDDIRNLDSNYEDNDELSQLLENIKDRHNRINDAICNMIENEESNDNIGNDETVGKMSNDSQLGNFINSNNEWQNVMDSFTKKHCEKKENFDSQLTERIIEVESLKELLKAAKEQASQLTFDKNENDENKENKEENREASDETTEFVNTKMEFDETDQLSKIIGNLNDRDGIYASELAGRIEDLITFKDIETKEELEKLINEAKLRHVKYQVDFKNTMINENKNEYDDDGNVNDESEEKYDIFVSNNKEWIAALGGLFDALLLRRKERENERETEKETEIESELKESMNNANDNDKYNDNDNNENNNENNGGMGDENENENEMGARESDKSLVEALNELNDIQNDNKMMEENQENEEIEVLNPHLWWLDRSEPRRNYIDSIVVNNNGKEDVNIRHIGYYLDRLFNMFGNIESTTQRVIPLYIEIPKKDNHHILSVCFDGVLLCYFINQIEADFIDLRCINRPNCDETKAMPLSDEKVCQNMQLVFSSMDSLGLSIDLGNGNKAFDMIDGWFDSKLMCKILMTIFDQLSLGYLDAVWMNLSSHPELVRLTNQNVENADSLRSDNWIKRWINYHLKRNDLKKDIVNWNDDLWNLLKTMHDDCQFSEKNRQILNCNCEEMIHFIKNDLYVNTNILGQDLLDDNLYLQQLLTCQLYTKQSGLDQLDENELESKYDHDQSKKLKSETQMTLSWINSLLPNHLRIFNLYRDLADGIILLKLMESANPGCVEWTKKNVKMSPKTKFDNLQNCNYAMNKVSKKFSFYKTLRTKGEDFVRATERTVHQKQVISFLWQLMRYYATKQLTQLNLDSDSEISEKDIIKWGNKKLEEHGIDNKISSFNDLQLTTCVYYCQLLKCIIPQSVNMSLVHKDISVLEKFGNDNDVKERLENARYCMSLIRRSGGKLFVMPEDLVSKEPKAVLSVLAAIMTIDMKGVKKASTPDMQIAQCLDID